ncbi:MAG: transcriptional regulator, LuxR family, partial [Chthonomonadales bacterium]|nr:transcriptional regulator, LuxR family [Chthonomonadales bacterium]
MTNSAPRTIAIPFSLNLFGPFAATVAGRPMARLRSRKGQWILTLLALRAGSAVERDWLAGTLWPDNAEDKALYSLRRSLTDLRQALEGEAWRIEAPTPRTLFLNLDGAQADIRIFDQGVAQADSAAWRQAVAVYKGPLLEGCSEEWVFQERNWREEVYLQTLERLAGEAMRSEEAAEAAEWLRQAVSVAPFRETAHRGLMQALAAQQDYAGVMLAYRDLRLRLRRELNAAPDPETTALLQQIRRSARQRGTQAAMQDTPLLLRNTSAESVAYDEVESTTEFVLPVVPRCLPHPRTRFVGHKQLLADLCRSLVVHRLVTLTGTGGVGKTRLAVQAARETENLYMGGMWLVDLAPLHDSALVMRAVAQALAVSAPPECSLPEAVTDFLNASGSASRPTTLLLMDNCEHLLEECAGVVEVLMRACPRLHILATSRQALGLAGEIRYRIPSLPTPMRPSRSWSETEVAGLTERYPALELFIERAQSSNPAFALTVENAQFIAQICHLLDGIPLAIELAAARVRAMPLQALAIRLNNRLQLLISEDKTGPPRHRTLTGLVAWSVDLLSPAERTVLCHLAAFRAGWTLHAAEVVCGGDTSSGIAEVDVLDLLTSLVDKSLVLYDPAASEERYHLQETIRQYAWQLLGETDRDRGIQNCHLRYYLSLVHEADAGLAGPEQGRCLAKLERERYNLDAALTWAANTPERHIDGIELAGLLARFWLLRGYWREGRAWFERLLSVS